MSRHVNPKNLDKQAKKKKKKGNNSQFKKILIGGGGGGYFLCVNLRKSGVEGPPLMIRA